MSETPWGALSESGSSPASRSRSEQPWAALSDDEGSASTPRAPQDGQGAWVGVSSDEEANAEPEVAPEAPSAQESALVCVAEGRPLLPVFAHGLLDVGLRMGRLRHRGIFAALAPVTSVIQSFVAEQGSASVGLEAGPGGMPARPAIPSASAQGLPALAHDGLADEGVAEMALAVAERLAAPQLPMITSLFHRFRGLHVAIERAACILGAVWAHSPRDRVADPCPKEAEVLDHLLRAKSSIASGSVEAAMVGSSTWTLRRLRQVIACAALVSHCRDCVVMLRQVAQAIQSNGGRCLCLIEAYKGDETSLKFTVADREPTRARSSSSTALVATRGAPCEAVAKQAAITKTLQSHRALAALFETKPGEHLLLRCSIPVHLQVMASTKMEVYYKCFEQTSLPLEDLRGMFAARHRLCVTDGDLAVAASLRGVQAQDTGTKQLSYQCEIHKLANLVGGVMRPPQMQAHVGSLIAFAQSLQMANAMRDFRDSLRLALASRLQWKRRQPKREDFQRNSYIAQLCMPEASRTSALRLSVLLRLFNGKWARTDAVEHACTGPSCCASRDDCLQKMITIGVAVVSGISPPTFRRDRWTGCVGSISWPLLLESMHGLLGLSYRLWAARQRGGKGVADGELPHTVLPGALALEEGAPSHLLGDAADASGALGSAGPADAREVGGGGSSSAPAPGHLGATDLDAKRAEQSRNRHAALQWLNSAPLGMLFVMRLVLGPTNDCVERYLKIAGRPWEDQQVNVEAQAHMSPGSAGRSYRVCLAEAGYMVDGPLAKAMDLLSSPTAWDHLPHRFRTASLRTRATLLLSQAPRRLPNTLAEQSLERLSGSPCCNRLACMCDPASSDHQLARWASRQPCLLCSHAPFSQWPAR